ELFPWVQSAFARPSVFNEQLLADLIAQRIQSQPPIRHLPDTPPVKREALEISRADSTEDDFDNFMAVFAALKN
ncbi:MAG: hypothetical protein K8I82_02235, partial [Anaerolineae bacterium]|nr:hypothetical protein [Anaerolineae bacterium]